MSNYVNPEIVNDGLVCMLDAANIKSYNPAENLLKYSEQLSTSPWNKYSPNSNITVTENNINAPNGTLTGNRITDSNNANSGSIYIDASGITGNGTYTASIFVKAGTNTTVAFGMFFLSGGTTQGFFSNFNIATGAFTSGSGTVVNYGNGWYQISVTATGTDAANTVVRLEMYQQATGYMYAWGAQINAGAYLRPYTKVTNTSIAASTAWTDISGNGIVGTLVNSPPLVNTNSGSFLFNGTNSAVNLPNTALLQFLNRSPYSFEQWVYPVTDTSASYPGFLNRESNPGTGRDGYNNYYTNVSQTAGTHYVATERFGTGTNTNVGVSLTDAVFFNNWHCLCTTYDGTTLSFYRNGSLINSAASTQNITNTVQVVTIGQRGGVYSNSRISSTKFYNRALTANQVLQNFNAYRGRFGI